MATVTEQIDIFHESICKMHLYTEILEAPAESIRKNAKPKYYSIDEYTDNQKKILLGELKGQLLKHAPSLIEKHQNEPKCTFTLAHRHRLKKFFAFEFHNVVAANQGQDFEPLKG